MFAAKEWRMKVKNEQRKPHGKRMSVVQEFTVSLSLIKSIVTIFYIKEEFESIRDQFESTNWI